ncbi:hypothetical protein HW509_13300 [Asaia spathodeae]
MPTDFPLHSLFRSRNKKEVDRVSDAAWSTPAGWALDFEVTWNLQENSFLYRIVLLYQKTLDGKFSPRNCLLLELSVFPENQEIFSILSMHDDDSA